MKRLFLLFFSLFLVGGLFSQQVEREMVVLEIATGTWCYYCPGAAMGADDMIANGDDVAVVENHNGDPFANTYSNSRNNYYNVSGFPTAVFDGDIKYVGGSNSQSLFNTYHARYSYRKDIPSSFTLDIYGEADGNNYSILLVAQKVADYEGDNLVVHLALTESEIDFNWQGMSEVNFVNRLMVPNQYGTELDFSTSDIQYVELNFTFDDEWVAEHCEFAAYIQDTDSKEIQQGTKVALTAMETAPVMANFSASQTEVCEGNAIEFTDDSFGNPTEYTWLFEGGTPQMSNEPNPTVTYEAEGTYDVTLQVGDGNNEHTITMEGYVTVENCTGISEEKANRLKLWPNPATDVVYIDIPAIEEKAVVSVYDLKGKLVLQKSVANYPGKEIKLNLSPLKKGTYFIEFDGENTVQSRKIIIE